MLMKLSLSDTGLLRTALCGYLQAQARQEVQHRAFGFADKADDFGADLQEKGHDADDDKGDPVGVVQRGRGLNDRQNSEKRGDSVNNQHGLTMAEAKLAQAMVQMPLVRREDRFLLHPAAQNRKERIRQRHANQNERRQEGNDRYLFEPVQGQQRKAEAQEQRAGVAHKDLRRVEVEIKEADNAAQQQHANHADNFVAGNKGHDGNGADGNGGYAGCQTVQTVDQIDGVGHADDPKQCKRYRNPAFNGRIRMKRNVCEFKPDIKAEHNDASRCNLNQKFQFGVKLKTVIQRAQQHRHRAAYGERLDEVLVVYGKNAVRNKRKQSEQSYHYGDKHAQSAESRHDLGMHLPGIRLIYGAYIKSEFFDERSKDECEHER